MARSRIPPHKRPSFNQLIVAEKRPRFEYDGASFYKQRPAWRVAILEMVDAYSWHEIGATKIADIRSKLANFESMTWSQILQDAKKHNHLVPVTSIIPKAQKRLLEIDQQVDDLVSLHLSGQERIWGILEDYILRVLWWDPFHEICPSKLKHT
jgi:hypothetical protein